MELREYSEREVLILAHRVGLACAQYFRDLARELRPVHRSLAAVLECIAERKEDYACMIERMEQCAPWPRVSRLDAGALQRLLRDHFPSLDVAARMDHGDRRAVLRFAEQLEEEAGRFYRILAGVSIGVLRELFEDMELDGGERIEELQLLAAPRM